MEDFIRAIGAEPVIYAYRNECCGGYVDDGRQAAGAEEEQRRDGQRRRTCRRGACWSPHVPLCLYNLTQERAGEHRLPVVYFTELLAEALGVKD